MAYREGLADTLLFANAKIVRGDKKLPKALDRCSLDKLMKIQFEELEEEMETARDLFVFACHTGAAYCDLMELSRLHLVRDDEGSLLAEVQQAEDRRTLPYQVVARSHQDNREVQER